MVLAGLRQDPSYALPAVAQVDLGMVRHAGRAGVSGSWSDPLPQRSISSTMLANDGGGTLATEYASWTSLTQL